MAPPKTQAEELTRDELFQIIDERIAEQFTKLREAIKEDMKASMHSCVFTPEQIKHMSDYVASVDRLGEGNFTQGYLIMEANQRWLKEQRERGGKIASAFFIGLVTAIGAGIITLVVEGIKKWVGK